VYRNFHFVGDSLLDGDCVGLGDRVGYFLGDYDGSNVFLLVLLFVTALYISSAIGVLFKAALLLFSRTQSEDYRQQSAYLDDRKYVRNLVVTLLENIMGTWG
jgi:hypothetical protein